MDSSLVAEILSAHSDLKEYFSNEEIESFSDYLSWADDAHDACAGIEKEFTRRCQ